MRRSVLSVILAAALSLVACSDQPTEVQAPGAIPVEPGAAAVVGCPTTPTSGQILTLINDLLPRSPIRTSVITLINSLPPRAQDRLKTAVRNRIFIIQDLIIRAFYAGRLKGGTSDATFDKVLDLIEALYCYVGLTPPEFPTTTSGSDVVVGVVFPNSPTTTLSVPSEQAAVTIPTGAAPSATTIVITKLPDSPGPLRTSLDQYPFFYHFSGTTATGPVTFNADVIAGICLKEQPIGVPQENFRLAHNVAPFGFGDVEVLPRPTGTPPGVDCSDLPAESEPIGSIGNWGRRSFAWAEKVFFPAELHAASTALVTLPVGGTTKKFSEFGIVDQESNPASLGIVDESGEPTSGTVSGPGTVYVKTTSQNGTPIKDVPVDFDGTEVLTDADGIAAFEWDATPGTTLTATVLLDEGEVCPSITPHLETAAYRPRVCFTPSSVTFTAPPVPTPGADVIMFNDVNLFDNTAAEDLNNVQFFKNLVNFTATGARNAGSSVLISRGHGSLCADSADPGCDWTTFGATLTGEGYTVTDGDDLTTPIAADIKVIVIVVPTELFSNVEINALKAFAGEGGRVVFVGEHEGFYSQTGIDVENDFLAKMGATMQNTGGAVDCDYTILPLSSLRDHQVTGGLDQLTVACASVVVLGPDDYALFYDVTNTEVLGAVAKIDLTPLASISRLRRLGETMTPTPRTRAASEARVFTWGFQR